MDADVIVLVTEPTPFGLYDLSLAQKAFAPLGKPMGVIINRADIGTQDVYDHCQKTGLPILAEIPFQRDIAEAYAQGLIIADRIPSIRPLFETLVGRIKTLYGQPSETREVRHA